MAGCVLYSLVDDSKEVEQKKSDKSETPKDFLTWKTEDVTTIVKKLNKDGR